MSKLVTERTATGEAVVLIAEIIGEGLSAGLNAFLDECRAADVKYIDRGAVLQVIGDLLKHQLTSTTGTRTVAKSYFKDANIDDEIVEIDGGCV